MKAKFDIISHRKWYFLLSALIVIPGVISIIVQGFNLGIDFTGGTLLDMRFNKPVQVAEVREVLQQFDLQNSTIQLSSSSEQAQSASDVFIRTRVLDESEQKQIMTGMRDKIGDFTLLRSEKVGAIIGSELTRQAIVAVLVAAVLMIVYINFRFEFKFAISAIIALFHDVLLVMGIFSLLRIEVDSSFVAAILTILGYSINDTIVIFDRIRENLKTHRKEESFSDMVNRSIWQVMTRSIYTVLTVVMATAALLFFGGETTKNFALALLIGFVSGCYSSIFNASPIWVTWKEWAERKRIAMRTRGN